MIREVSLPVTAARRPASRSPSRIASCCVLLSRCDTVATARARRATATLLSEALYNACAMQMAGSGVALGAVLGNAVTFDAGRCRAMPRCALRTRTRALIPPGVCERLLLNTLVGNRGAASAAWPEPSSVDVGEEHRRVGVAESPDALDVQKVSGQGLCDLAVA